MNKVLLEGRIIRSDADDKKTKFTIATTESYKDKSGTVKEITDYHNCIIWKPIKLEKGDEVKIEGKLKTTKYNDKYYTNVVVYNEKDIQKKGEVIEEKIKEAKTFIDEEIEDVVPF